MKNIFNNQPHTTDHALWVLLGKLQVKVTFASSTACVQDHPNYPSLFAISGCLSDWGVENNTYKLDKEKERGTLLYPFIAHFPEKGGRYLVVTGIKGGKVFYSDETTEIGILTEDEFVIRWDGIALHAESGTLSGEVNYIQNRLREIFRSAMMPLAVLSLIIIGYYALNHRADLGSVLVLCLIKLAGVGMSILLLIQSLNANNLFIKNLCNIGGKNDCNAILKSDAAQLTPWLSWSEIGFYYFTGSFLAVLFIPVSFPLLAWLNLFTLPYIFYSIHYQYTKKNWCILCCMVQALLAFEAITFFSSLNYQLAEIPAAGLLSVVVSFLIPILAWSFMKPFFADAGQITSLKKQLNKFKYNSDLFNHILQAQPRYMVGEELFPIRFGNPNASTVITMVTNPFCGPCAKAHQTISEWLKHQDGIQLQVIFTTANEENDLRTKVARHLSALSRFENEIDIENALNAWYTTSNRDYEEWAKYYPVQIDAETETAIGKQREWCKIADITHTPTILVNGYKLPDPYRLEDLENLIA